MPKARSSSRPFQPAADLSPVAAVDSEPAHLRALALLDPLLAQARRLQKKGEAPPATYALACAAWDLSDAGRAAAYDPSPALFLYLEAHWGGLLLEGEAERAKAGRPTLLTVSLLENIADAAGVGLKDALIYQKLGVKQRTWSGWLADPEGELVRTLERARAELAERMLRLIPTMEKGWQAPVWVLNQIHPEHFSRPNVDGTTVNVSASASATASATSTIAKVSKEDLEARQARTKRKLQHQLDRLSVAGASGNN